MLYYQKNVKISSFYNLKLYIKNKFIDRIVGNIRFEWNLMCMLRTQRSWNLTIKILKFIPKKKKKKIYEKFKEFNFIFVFDQKLFEFQQDLFCVQWFVMSFKWFSKKKMTKSLRAYASMDAKIL